MLFRVFSGVSALCSVRGATRVLFRVRSPIVWVGDFCVFVCVCAGRGGGGIGAGFLIVMLISGDAGHLELSLEYGVLYLLIERSFFSEFLFGFDIFLRYVQYLCSLLICFT